MLFSKVAFISDVRFLATTWDQGIFFNLVGGSGACGRCVTALTDPLDILSERTMMKFRNWKITKLFVVSKSISVGSTPSPDVVTQCSKLCQPLTSLSLTSSDSE